MAAWTFASYAAATAIMYVGGILINSLTGVSTADTSNSQSATYSWSEARTTTSQGSAIPLTFGKLKITNNNVLSAHATSDGEKQHLNLLICGGEGPIDNISDIRIDSNPIAYYKDVEHEIRLGTNEQQMISIPSFADAYADRTLSYELSEAEWSTQLLEGNANQGLEVTISFSRGLYHANNDGGLEEAWVEVVGEYRGILSNTWTTFLNTRISGATSSAMYRQFSVRDLKSGEYEVRVKVAKRSADVTSSRDGVRAYWTNLAGIMTDNFRYPGMVLVAIKALATDQLSGSSPTVTWIQERKNILVFNPETQQYENKRASNPAWACYDILHLCRKIYDERTGQYTYDVGGAPANLIIYNDFSRWAAACDERNLVCNFYLDATGDLDAAWKPFEAAGRGKVVRRGTKYGCVFDHVAEPVQLFSVGNIKMGSFNLSYLPMEDRANAVEISFNNERKDYTRDTMMVYTAAYESDLGVVSPTQITLDAITNPDQIYREGKYYLRKNEYLVRTVSFEADVDAVSCQVGDVVLVQHDIPQWGFGGRIKEVMDSSTLVLDHTVKLESGKNYEITVRMQDDTLVTRAVKVGANDETDTLSVMTPFDNLPMQYDVYSFGELNISTKPFTVITLTRSSDTTVQLQMLEYNEAVYSEADVVPEIDYSQLDTAINIKSLSLGEETYLSQDGTLVSNIYVSWLAERSSSPAKDYDVYYGADNKNWLKSETTCENRSIISNVKSLTTYYVKVAANNEAGVPGPSKIESVYITGKNKAPNKPDNFRAERCKGGVMLSWDANIEPDIAGYNVYIGKNAVSFANSELSNEKFSGTSIFVPLSKNAAYIFYVTAVDNVGNASYPANFNFYLESPREPDWFDVVAIDSDIDFRWRGSDNSLTYEIREGESWEYGTKIIETSANAYRLLYPTVGAHTFWIKTFDEYGNYCENPLKSMVEMTGTCDRNIIKALNQVANKWNGSTVNAHVNGYGFLQMDNTCVNSEHIVSVELPKRFKLRNWIEYKLTVLDDNSLSWGEAAFAWNSDTANRPWLQTIDNSGVSLKNYVSVWKGLDENVIDSISLNNKTVSTNGVTASESNNVFYKASKFYDGAYIKDTTQLSWGLSIPAIFSFAFTIVTETLINTDVVYMKLFADDDYMIIGYDLHDRCFYIGDKNDNRNKLQINFMAKDFIRIGITQSAGSRTLFVSSVATGNYGTVAITAQPIGQIKNVYCYNKN